MSHFAFLAPEWTEIHEAATRAETAALPDPRTACFHARRGLELIVHGQANGGQANGVRPSFVAGALGDQTHTGV